jgi:hypothetical protein
VTWLPGHAVWPYAWRIALLLAAAVALGAQFSGGTAVPPSRVASSVAPGSEVPKAEPADAAASYPAIAMYPLFDPSRKPWQPPPVVAVVAPVFLPPPRPAPLAPRGYTLIGMVTTGSHATALLRGYAGTTVRLTLGQMLDGWRVRAIGHGRVRLEAQGASYEIAFPGISLTGRPRTVP